MDPTIASSLVSSQAFAQLLKVSQRTVSRWIETGTVPYVESGLEGSRRAYRLPLQGALGSLPDNYDLAGELTRLHRGAELTRLSERELAEALAEDPA